MNRVILENNLKAVLETCLSEPYCVKEVKFYNDNNLEIRIEDCVHTIKILSVKNSCIIKCNLDYVLQGTGVNSHVIADAIASVLGYDVYVIDKYITCDEAVDYLEPAIIYDILEEPCVSFAYLDEDNILNIVHNDELNEIDKLKSYLDNTKFTDISKEFKYKLKSLKEFITEALIENGIYRTSLDKSDIKSIQEYFKKSEEFKTPEDF